MKAAKKRVWLDFNSFQKRAYFTALDGVRALSIFLVLLFHSPRIEPVGIKYLLRTLQENGSYGVGVFFLISGFLISTLLLREERSAGKIDLGKFYGRRALRLLPLYYVLLLVQSILVFVLHQYSPENQLLFREKLPSYIFYYSNWLPASSQGPFFCAWSLAAEEQFYLFFGLLLWFAPRRFLLPTVFLALMVKCIAYQLFGTLGATSIIWRILFSYREPILMGVIIGFALNSSRGHNFLGRWVASAWVTASVSLLACCWLLMHRIRHESSWDAQLFYLISALVLIGLVMRSEVSVLTARPLVYIGRISYGMYLLHPFIFGAANKVSRSLPFFVTFIGTTTLTILLASLSYKYFEQRLIRLYKKRLSPVPSTDASTAAEAAHAPQKASSALSRDNENQLVNGPSTDCRATMLITNTPALSENRP